MTSDRRLVKIFLLRKSEKVFRELYRRHSGALYRVAWRLLGGVRQDAEDVVQETWIRAVEGLPRFRWGSSLRTWLVGITINRSRELMRARSRSPAGDEVQDTVAEQARPSPDRIDLELAIARLPSGSREVLILHEIEGYTHEEIGRLLGIDEGTSKSQLHHARRALRGWLETQGGAS